MSERLNRILELLLAAFLTAFVFSGCRLYEPEHYDRLTFAPGQKQLRVLMIGDSLTYYNDLPGILQQLSSRESSPIYIEKVTVPFRSLKGHWNSGDAQERIRTGRFDYVVLQDFSREPASNPSVSLKYHVLFDEVIRASGGKTIIFQNWTRFLFASDYPKMEQTYKEIQQRIHAPIAPIGTAWKLCREKYPEIKLLMDDRHPTNAGSYLAACVLYDTIYQRKSSTLPLSIPAPKLPEGTLMLLRTLADQAVAANPPMPR